MKEALLEAQKQFQTMFQFHSTGMALTNLEGKFIQTNLAFQKIVGYSSEELYNLSLCDLDHVSCRTESLELLQDMFCGKRTHFSGETRITRKDGSLLWADRSVSIVCDANGLPLYAIAMFQDITDSKQSQLALQKAYEEVEKQLTERTTELVQANMLLVQEIDQRQKTQDALEARQEFLQTLIDIYPNTVFAKGSFAVVTDATTLEAMESELQQTKEQLRAVLDAMPGIVAWINAQGRYLGVNQHMANTFNLSPEDFVGKELSFRENSSDLAQFMTQFLAEDAQTDRQVIEVQFNGLLRNYLIAAQKYHHGSLAVLVGIDITERKQSEAQLQASLQEKEVLLQEVHHRVKNNLQVITSLLDLQSQQIEEPVMLEVFRESQNRVKSMALVHEKLYQSKNLTGINFSEYTQSLTNYLLRAYELNTGYITLELDIEEITLNIDTAIPCGLIINELVSNALKHAFPDKMSGKIKIILHAEFNDSFILSVEDNGVGFPPDWEFSRAKSLGIQLIKVLTNQLKGNVEIEQNAGSKIRVKFSEFSR